MLLVVPLFSKLLICGLTWHLACSLFWNISLVCRPFILCYYTFEIQNAVWYQWHVMNAMKLVNPLHSLYWSIHTKDKSKHRSTFAFIFGVNWLWHFGITASFGVFLHEIKCNGRTSFLEFMICVKWSFSHLKFCCQ